MQDQPTSNQTQDPKSSGEQPVSAGEGLVSQVSQPTSAGATIFQPAEGQQLDTPIPRRLLPKIPKTLFAIAIVLVLLIGLAFMLIKLQGGIGIKITGKKGEITWWGFWDKSVIQPLINDYQAQNPDVVIHYLTQPQQDYRERLTNALARGTGPDIFRFHNTWVPMYKNSLDTLPASVMSQSEFASTFYPVIVSDLTTDDGIVGMPLGFDAITLYINEDMLALAGKTPPSTWDQVRQLAIELTTRDQQQVISQSGISLGITENIDHWPEIIGLMMIQDGVNLLNPQSESAGKVFEFYSVFYGEDEVWDKTLPVSTVAFAYGKAAMYFGPSWRATEINKLNPNLRYKTVVLPQLRKEDPGEPDISYATYWIEGVSKRSASSDIAWDFLKFLSERESLIKLYDNQAILNLIGEPYPRIDMGDLLLEHPIIGSIIALAPNARSWYLADATFDGETGINSQLNTLFEEVVRKKNSSSMAKALVNLSQEVGKVLLQYGIRVR